MMGSRSEVGALMPLVGFGIILLPVAAFGGFASALFSFPPACFLVALFGFTSSGAGGVVALVAVAFALVVLAGAGRVGDAAAADCAFAFERVVLVRSAIWTVFECE
jgi:hypothetical protein